MRVPFQGARGRLAKHRPRRSGMVSLLRSSGSAQSWWTKDEVEKAKAAAFAEVKDRVNPAMLRDAELQSATAAQFLYFDLVESGCKAEGASATGGRLRPDATARLHVQMHMPIRGDRLRFLLPFMWTITLAELVFGQSVGTIRAMLDNLPFIAVDSLTEMLRRMWRWLTETRSADCDRQRYAEACTEAA